MKTFMKFWNARMTEEYKKGLSLCVCFPNATTALSGITMIEISPRKVKAYLSSNGRLEKSIKILDACNPTSDWALIEAVLA